MTISITYEHSPFYLIKRSVSHSVMSDSVIPWIVAYEATLSMGFSWQEYWGLPFPSPEDLPDPGIKPRSPVLQEDSLLFEQQGRPFGWALGVGVGQGGLACCSSRGLKELDGTELN